MGGQGASLVPACTRGSVSLLSFTRDDLFLSWNKVLESGTNQLGMSQVALEREGVAAVAAEEEENGEEG